jgi:hypothetical protein
MSEGKQHDNDHDDRKRLLHHIFVLLDYLERQNDNRLQAQFDDTRLKLASTLQKQQYLPATSPTG